jgi:hypothetical protein
MFDWFRKQTQYSAPQPDAQTAARIKRQAECKHNGRFTFYGYNTACPPCGECRDCGAEVGLDTIMNVYIGKMDALLDKAGIR